MSTNNTTSLATVADVTGKVWAVAEDGTRHLLQTGDAVYEGECILTESGGQVVLKAANGADLKVTESKEVALSGGLFERSENTFSLDLRGLIAATEDVPEDGVSGPPRAPAPAPLPAPSAAFSAMLSQSVGQGSSAAGSVQNLHGFISVERANESVTSPAYQLWSFTGNYNSASQSRSSGSDALLEGRGTFDERLSMPLEPLVFTAAEPLLLPPLSPVVPRIPLLPDTNAGTTIVIPDSNGGSVPGNETVDEAALIDGSNPASTREVVSSTFTITAPDGLANLIVGGTTVSAGSLAGSATVPVTIITEYGTLVINGYAPNPATGGGVVSYTYTLLDNTLNHGPGNNGANTVLDSIAITVTDTDGDSSTGVLDIGVVDDLPTARPDEDTVTKDSKLIATGNVVNGSTPANENDTIGADNTPVAPVTGVRAGSDTGSPAVGNVAGPVEGSYGRVVVGADGSYTYTLNNDNAEVQALTLGGSLIETFVYTITDADGDQSTAILTIRILGSDAGTTIVIPDTNGGSTPGDETVYEAALFDGSNPPSPLEAVSSTFTVTAPDGLATLTVGGTTISAGALAGSATVPVTIVMEYGTLVINGYTPSSGTGGGVVHYTYTLADNTLDHGYANNGPNTVLDSVSITVTDTDGDSSTDILDICVVDDLPTASPDEDTVTKDTKLIATGNVVNGSTPANENDTIGADNNPVIPVTGVRAGSDTSTPVVGHVTESVLGSYGSVVIGADGSYTYTLDNDNAAVHALMTDESLVDTFVYTITDADGDQSTTTLTIRILGSNTVPTIVIPDSNGTGTSGDETVFEAALPVLGIVGSGLNITPGASYFVSSAFTITAPDGLAGITITDKNGTLHPITETALNASGTTHITIDTKYGSLEINGYTPNPETGGGVVSYTYTLADNTLAHTLSGIDAVLDSIAITVTDSDGDFSNDTLDIRVVDDVPLARLDADTVTKGSFLPVTGNVVNGNSPASENDIIGADNSLAAPVTGVRVPVNGDITTPVTSTFIAGTATVVGSFGSVMMGNGGSYSYTLDNDNTQVKELTTGQTLTDTFVYTITDADGDLSTTTLTITIQAGLDYDPTIDIPDNNGDSTSGDETVYEAALLSPVGSGNGLPALGSYKVDSFFTITALDGLASITVIDGLGVSHEILKAELTGTMPLTSITTEYGSLVITGYTEYPLTGGGEVHYIYTLTDNTTDHTLSANDAVLDSIAITVTDTDGDTASHPLEIRVVDDIPVALLDTKIVTRTTELTVTVSGNVITNDTAGADGGVTVTGVKADSSISTPATSNVNTSVLSSNGYGSVKILANGSYDYVLNNENPTVKNLLKNSTLTDTFVYTITDGDGDKSTTTLTITIYAPGDVHNAVQEDKLTGGNLDAANDVTVVTGSIADLVAAGTPTPVVFSLQTGSLAGLGLKSGGTLLSYSVVGSTLDGYVELNSNSVYNAGVDRPVFTLVLSGSDYTFTLLGPLDHLTGSGDNATLDISLTSAITATGNGNPATIDGTFVITVENDVPLAFADTNSVKEDTTLSVTANVITANDLQGADGVTVTGVKTGSNTTTAAPDNFSGLTATVAGTYGTVVVGHDGSYTYTLTNTNPAVQALLEGATLLDHFVYTITDGDGDKSTTTLDITINGTGAVPTITSPSNILYEKNLSPNGTVPNIPALTVPNTFTIVAGSGLDLLTLVDGLDPLVPHNITKASLLSSSLASPIQINTKYGALRIIGYVEGTGVVSYTYTLTASTTDHGPLDNQINNVFDNITVTVTDSDGITSAPGTLGITVVDDVPTAVNDFFTGGTPWVWVNEGQDSVLKTVTDSAGTRTATAATYNLLANELNSFGADQPATKSVTAIQYTDGTGSHWVNVGTTVTVTTLYGGLTVKANGDVTYTSNMSVPHPSNDIRDDLFNYTITDADGDTSQASAAVRIMDLGVGIQTSSVASVLESGLSGGDVVSSASLVDVQFNADPLDLRFYYNAVSRALTLYPLNGESGTTFAQLTSNGNSLNYYMVPDALAPNVSHTLIAYAGGVVVGLPSVEKRVFTITITNNAPNANPDPTYTFTLHQQLDGFTAGTPTKLVLNFSQVNSGDGIPGFVVTETLTGSGVFNDSAYIGFNVEVNDQEITGYVAPTDSNDTLVYDGYADVNSSKDYNALGGTDTLQLWYEGCIDFSVLRHIANIEVIDLTVKGDHSLWNITAADAYNMSDHSGATKVLTILGDVGDNVSFIGGVWTKASGGGVGGLDRYTNTTNPTYSVDVAVAINDTFL